MAEILGFFGENRFLSNFYGAETQKDIDRGLVQIDYRGYRFPSVENAYQAAKCLHPAEMEPFTTCTAKEAKSLGRKVRMDPQFNKHKIDVMTTLLGMKFAIPALHDMLQSTGYAYLEETNTWNDQFWGVCNGYGRNHLGKLLMETRWKARSGSLVIFGGREFTDYDTLVSWVERTALFKQNQVRRLITGKAPGVDTLGERWARSFNRETAVPVEGRGYDKYKQTSIPVKEMPAAWKHMTPGCRVGINKRGEEYNKDAGHHRNRSMAVMATHAIGFWNRRSPGTRNMIQECKDHNVHLLVVYTDDWTYEIFPPAREKVFGHSDEDGYHPPQNISNVDSHASDLPA